MFKKKTETQQNISQHTATHHTQHTQHTNMRFASEGCLVLGGESSKGDWGHFVDPGEEQPEPFKQTQQKQHTKPCFPLYNNMQPIQQQNQPLKKRKRVAEAVFCLGGVAIFVFVIANFVR